MLFVLGGNGTHAGANAIHEEVFCLWLLYLDYTLVYIICIFSNRVSKLGTKFKYEELETI